VTGGGGRHEVVLVRHGQTEWSLSGRHTGTTDIPLTEAGIRQASLIAALLAGRSFALVLTSPLVRAAETARLAGLGERAEVVDDLREWDYGDAEGRRTADIRVERPGWDLWHDGVTGGETADDVGRRADRVIERARAAGGDVVVFAHGHLLRVLAARWVGLPPAFGGRLALATASLSVLGWERERAVVESWNVTAHLVAEAAG
jgi:broad specificity phosphatase PhoE